MLVLASSSPRRAELLREWGYCFTTVFAPVEEKAVPGLPPAALVRRLAELKASAGAQKWGGLGGKADDLILAADTVVVLDNRILGKPGSPEIAKQMLQRLSGRTHVVLTGVALRQLSGAEESGVVATQVTFRQLDAAEVERYVASGEPMDKAGAYGIQGGAGGFVADVQGSYTNVIGLPMEYVSKQLRAWRIEQGGIAPRG